MSQQSTLQKELASRVLARRRLLPFIKRLDDKYLAGWVHEDICMRLEKFSEDVVKGLSPRLMLLMPPRHGKSRIASISFPAWHLGRYPDHEFISASYNVALAMGFSRKAQNVMEDPRYPFDGVALDPNNKSAETWGIAGKAGGYVAAGVGGGITGKGAHILSIDDPIKNHEEADSLVVREALWDWYTSTAYTRLAPGGGVLVIQTCWHDDDLAGRLQQVMRAATPGDPDVDFFEIIKYPAIAEHDEYIDDVTKEIIRVETKRDIGRDNMSDPVRRVVFKQAVAAEPQHVALMVENPHLKLVRIRGEPLHDERYDLPKLLRIQKTLPKRFWSALFQQNPVPDDGSFFTKSMFKRAMLPDKGACYAYLCFDFAITEKQHNDYTVGGVALQDNDDLVHMADVVRFKSGDAFFMVESIISLIKKWKDSDHLFMGFEHGQIFLSLEALLKKRMREERLFIPYETLVPVTDKKVRAAPLQGRMQQGRWSYSDSAEWYDVVQAEMLRFPNGINDDTIDMQAWIARLIALHEAPRKKEPKKLKSWRDNIGHADRSRSHMVS